MDGTGFAGGAIATIVVAPASADDGGATPPAAAAPVEAQPVKPNIAIDVNAMIPGIYDAVSFIVTVWIIEKLRLLEEATVLVARGIIVKLYVFYRMESIRT